MSYTHNNSEQLVTELKAKLAILVSGKDSISDQELKELDVAEEEFQEIFFDVARGPISEPYQLDILRMSLSYLLENAPEPFRGSPNDAIDAALDEAIAESGSPHLTGLLAMVRFMLQQHRLQTAH